MIEFSCEGCNRTVIEAESDHSKKSICNACHARGIKLPQIKLVEKWQARDGSYHDSLEAAEKYQLSHELQTALKTCEGYPDRQAQHLLSHFDIVRKGDTPKGVLVMPMFSPPDPVKAAKPALWFWSGFASAGAICGLLYYFAAA